MSDLEANSTPEEEEKIYSVKEFFETVSPNNTVSVSKMRRDQFSEVLLTPEIILNCEHENCQGDRLFRCTNSVVVSESFQESFVYFKCKNCDRTIKEYAISIKVENGETGGLMFKYGEFPQFGPPTPAKVVRILGSESEYYFKGRRSENQGLGIAAFAYYRRVVENQKNKIFNEIIRTVERIDPTNQALLNDLEAAKKQTQFAKAVESIKHAIPQVLLIDGHNPITLLHSALSEGIHAGTDEECLEIATSIRIIITEMVSRMDIALKDTAELKTAVSRILNKK